MGATQSTTTPCELQTPRGTLKGVQYNDINSGRPICQRYTGIPYARPPVGPLRWRRPQPLPKNWSFSSDQSIHGRDTTKGSIPGDFTHFAPVCPQPVYGSAGAAAPVPPRDAATPVSHVQDEDCLYLNIWIPCISPPKGGWPVQFYIHGGWLQIGNPMHDHMYDPFDLFRLTKYPRVIVTPGYRLNIFGFLTGTVLAGLGEDDMPGNYGFWDQRLALEWTARNIGWFGGDAGNISVGGLSAGANSTVFQLHYDTYRPRKEERLIKRVYLFSNAVGIQPNAHDAELTTRQFEEFSSKTLGLESAGAVSRIPPKELLGRLRAIPSEKLVALIAKLDLHTFRATTDGSFISPDFLSSLHDGSFTTRLANHGVSVFLGEVKDEMNLYRLVNPPKDLVGLQTQLLNYYPPTVVDGLLKHYTLPTSSGSAGDAEAWADIYARICGDCQVHAPIRGFVHTLLHPPSHDSQNRLNMALRADQVHRYRIEWRSQGLDEWVRREMGVTHSMCQFLWWWSGVRTGWTEEEMKCVGEWEGALGRWLLDGSVPGDGSDGLDSVRGEERERLVRVLKSDGTIRTEVENQERWREKTAVWNVMWESQRDEIARGHDGHLVVEGAGVIGAGNRNKSTRAKL